ncbi:proton-coupled folate transporter-like [Aricia agestis]|uniref:proton-coupled folate transporter-like n=1 Tax=Aricia agestis TaxID=91739 RepID=UPI001C209750|nr:proton-coupled folate transporter-like [Aricia agestis]
MDTNTKTSQLDKEQTVPLKDGTEDVQTLTFVEKLKHVRNNITVEPALALFIVPSVLAVLAAQNLNLDKACRVNLGFNDSACTALNLRKRANFSHEEDEVQKLIASVQAWKSVVHTSVPTILMLFVGAWSDKTGRRKICLLMPICGELLTCILNMINTYFFYEVSVEWTTFMEVIFPSLTGGWYTMILGAYSYLGDITSKEARTFRFGVLSLCMSVGFPIGMGASGVLLRYTGYYGVFGLSALIHLFNFVYILFSIRDHRKETLYLKDTSKGRVLGFLKDFFDFRSLRDTTHIVLKKGPNNRRLRMCLILMVVCLTFGPTWGEMSVMYIFTRYRFNWNEIMYSIYSTYALITHAVGTMFSISIFSKRLEMDDAVLGIISTFSKMAGSVILAFARTNNEIYAVPIVEILNGTTNIALRSIASKIVTQRELGKVYSLFGIAETMMPLVFAPMYSRVYILTLHVLPGAVFLLTLLATTPPFVIFIWFYRQHKQDARKTKFIIEEADNGT